MRGGTILSSNCYMVRCSHPSELKRVFALVEALVRRIFPPSCKIVPARLVPEMQRFVVIPGGEGPRWIAPVNWGLSEQVLRQWSPITPVSRAKWRIAMAAHRFHCSDRIPGATVIGIANLDYSGWSEMGLANSTKVVPIVYVARPSTTQKAVVSLFSIENENVDCVVKIALGSAAWPSIKRDYDNLQTIERIRPGLAPRPLKLFPRLKMSSQEWVAGEICLRPPEKTVHNFLESLWQSHSTTLSDLAQRLHRRLEALPSWEISDKIERMFDSIRCDDRVPSAFLHGDFVSWNLICHDSGRCRAIDWEFGDSDGAPLLDLFNYLFRFPFAAGAVNSLQMATKITLGLHGNLVKSILDRLGASYRYAEDALTLSFIALYVSRYSQVSVIERIRPQLNAIISSYPDRRN